MNKKFNLKEIIEGEALIKENFYNFFDWFCSDVSLKRRAKSLTAKVKFIAKTLNLDLEKYRAIYKNNCPFFGSLYDSFWIVDMNNEDVFINVVPYCGHDGAINKTKIYVSVNNKETSFEFLNWRTFKKELKENKELIEKMNIGTFLNEK